MERVFQLRCCDGSCILLANKEVGLNFHFVLVANEMKM